MRIIGHGIDMVDVTRIEGFLNSSQYNWAEKVFSADERAGADGPPHHTRYYAGGFAAKEAVAKALGTGFAGDVTWRGIEILRLPTGAPDVRLSGGALDVSKNLGVARWLISISHSGGFAVASAISVGD